MEDDVLDDLFTPAAGPGGSMADLMMGDTGNDPDQHLCALCGNLIEDPLEECPTCAATFDGEE